MTPKYDPITEDDPEIEDGPPNNDDLTSESELELPKKKAKVNNESSATSAKQTIPQQWGAQGLGLDEDGHKRIITNQWLSI